MRFGWKVVLGFFLFFSAYNFSTNNEITKDECFLLNWLQEKKPILEWGQTSKHFNYRVVFFHDKKARKKVQTWFEEFTPLLLNYPDIEFHHVLFPGGVSFLTPRPKVYAKIRSEILLLRKEIHASLSEKQRATLATLRVLWRVDDRRSITGMMSMPRHDLGVIILGGKGEVLASVKLVDKNTEIFFDLLS
ncbi:hypothetical protein HOF92_01700, partial [bacterium]|nr:hypothetical protein [bacterium]